jgi:GNAT superfamily N-acetyltransferase
MTAPRHTLLIRQARRDDVVHIVRLLADDTLGAQREQATIPLPVSYYQAFEAIDADPNNELLVAELEGAVVGTLQLTIMPSLTYQGGPRAQIEGVRIAADRRGDGLGAQLVEWAIERARARGCHMVQLTTDKQRPDALRFYQRLGFRATHEGMKRRLA